MIPGYFQRRNGPIYDVRFTSIGGTRFSFMGLELFTYSMGKRQTKIK